MPDDPIVECVPNVSEGRDRAVIAALAASIRTVPSVRLLHVDPGHDAHRTVFTFAGPPEAVADGAIALGHAVAAHVDMRRQHGAHPRVGALDVCPFVPVRGVSLARCAALARRVGATLAHDLDVPVFMYEAAAFDPSRRALPLLRRGEYEGLSGKLADPAFVPDFGPARPHPRLGAAIIGARPFLIAWNLSLDTADVSVARAIAAQVRESGRVTLDADGRPVRQPGRLRAVRAVGWGMPAYGHAQVSLNVLDFRVTPLHVAYRAVAEQAAVVGARVIGSELIGLVPLEALREAGRASIGAAAGTLPDAALVDAAIEALGLGAVTAFDPSTRVLEWALQGQGAAPHRAVDR
ncbi:glutamate formimidoyltransferase [Luteitalea sp. TBR-22]|uniref:glutamate formimidoyltransferase n=1 Tax=Luteitalea sp. TBR-22 TaxID=2802971 RepID=UPI001AF6E7D8|nr:glutamate formimidoyltransferase [Luteitalea sp. TBR-22]BCS33956.1 glutamate formimidoyltransferase [Luteitalea sp. TBR-22]